MPNPGAGSTPLFRGQRTERRPWPLTVLCVGGGLALGFSFWLALAGQAARAFGPGYWAYFIGTSGALAVALWGVWKLRRWALWAFPAALLADSGVLAAMGELRPVPLVIEVGLVLLVLAYRHAFRRRRIEKHASARDSR